MHMKTVQLYGSENRRHKNEVYAPLHIAHLAAVAATRVRILPSKYCTESKIPGTEYGNLGTKIVFLNKIIKI